MKVSVIVPVFNCENYLEECLLSLLNQTQKDMEIIAVDDGSVDNSLAILRQYERDYPKQLKVFAKENGGQASARNLALKYAKGEYYGYVDSDDWVEPDMYEQMIKMADENESDIVICDMVDHYPNKTIYHHSSEFQNKFMVTPSACNKIFKSSFVKCLQFPEGLWYEDFEYTTKALMLTDKISCVAKGFYHCHCREVSTMINHNAPKNLNMIHVLDHLYDFAIEQKLQKKYKDDLEYLVLEHIIITTINRVAEQSHPQKEQVIKELREYGRKRIPNLSVLLSYQRLPKKRKLIAYLNYHGFHKISKCILRLKKLIN